MNISQLRSRLSEGRIFHSYIITGSSPDGRLDAAKLISQSAVCSGANPPCGACRDCHKAQHGTHPDITIIEREKDAKEITIDTMRRVRAAASILPNEARGSVYIINGADTMNVQAQNAMLKVFEEPPAHATFVLLAENTDRLIPTIRSRCELIRLSPEEAERSPDSISAAKSILDAYIAHDDRSLIDALFALEKASRTELTDILSCLRELGVLAVADGKLSIDSFSLLTDTVDTAEKYASVNVSIGHIVGLMLAQLINK